VGQEEAQLLRLEQVERPRVEDDERLPRPMAPAFTNGVWATYSSGRRDVGASAAFSYSAWTNAN
jgi:hypothetical protein